MWQLPSIKNIHEEYQKISCHNFQNKEKEYKEMFEVNEILLRRKNKVILAEGNRDYVKPFRNLKKNTQ